MTRPLATKLGRVLAGQEGGRRAVSVNDLDATVAIYARATGGLTDEEQRDVETVRETLR